MSEVGKGEPQYQEAFDLMESIGQSQNMGLYTSWSYHDDPRRVAFMLSRYKFVAKMLEGAENALEVGCSDGFASRIVRQTVGRITAVDFDPRSIASAQATVSSRWPITFRLHDMLNGPVEGPFDAIYSLDTLEHIAEADEDRFIRNMIAPLTARGVTIIGMPSLQSQAYASAHSRIGHVNCKDQRDLKRLMQRYFDNVFMFAMNDEVVHTGHHAMAHYILAMCCGKRAEVAA